jgi:pimeloyl-ACP methyl ester carboxylesterase
MTRLEDRPVVVIVPGFMRTANELSVLPPHLAPRFEVAFWNLPGHLAPRIAGYGVEPIAKALAAHLEATYAGREVLLVGESLGGLVGLMLAPFAPDCLKQIFAIDPPLQTAKLWPVQREIRNKWLQFPKATLLAIYAEPVFGQSQDGTITDRDYRDVLEAKPRVGVNVLTGDVPLMPPRLMSTAPSLMDDEDRELVAAADGYCLHVFEGGLGHVLLTLAPERCVAFIEQAYLAVE